MNVWKLGIRWGKGAPNFYDMIKKNGIILGHEHDGFAVKNDLVMIADGFTVMAIAHLLENAHPVTDEPSLQKDFEPYEIGFDSGTLFAKAEWIELEKKDWFQYKTQDGICQVQQGETIMKAIKFYKIHKANRMKTRIIELLEHKPQIILQGPPGTGKTRLAEEVAKAMTAAKTESGPMTKIDAFFKTEVASNPEVQKQRAEEQALLHRFWNRFPKENIATMSKEDYAIGTGSNDSFCWWMERGLKPLGYYTPGSSRAYMLFWSPSKEAYSKHSKLKAIDDDDAAMLELSSAWGDLVANKNYAEHVGFLGNSLMLKVLNSYYPDEYFPIYSVVCLTNALKLFGVDSTGMDPSEKSKAIQAFFLKKKADFKADVTNFEFTRFLFNEFGLHEIKFVEGGAITFSGALKMVQFHPAYSYEDFVRGIVASVDDDGKVGYSVENKDLVNFAKLAADNPKGKYVLIIDEINRANLPAVLGELIYALEYRGRSIDGMYEFEGEKAIVLPTNLYIIGTMNTADRSVGHIDYAIRRRFAFVSIPPSRAVLAEVLADVAVRAKAEALFDAVAGLFGKEGIAPSFDAHDVQIGHSYFLAQTEEALRLKLEYEIKPILREYLKDGILQGSTEKLIEDLHV